MLSVTGITSHHHAPRPSAPCVQSEHALLPCFSSAARAGRRARCAPRVARDVASAALHLGAPSSRHAARRTGAACSRAPPLRSLVTRGGADISLPGCARPTGRGRWARTFSGGRRQRADELPERAADDSSAHRWPCDGAHAQPGRAALRRRGRDAARAPAARGVRQARARMPVAPLHAVKPLVAAGARLAPRRAGPRTALLHCSRACMPGTHRLRWGHPAHAATCSVATSWRCAVRSTPSRCSCAVSSRWRATRWCLIRQATSRSRACPRAARRAYVAGPSPRVGLLLATLLRVALGSDGGSAPSGCVMHALIPCVHPHTAALRRAACRRGTAG